MQRQERLARLAERKSKDKTLDGQAANLLKGLGNLFKADASKAELQRKIAAAKGETGRKPAWAGRKDPKEIDERNAMVENAIMNHHTRTSVQTGIVDVHLTVGPSEASLFGEESARRKLAKEQPWERIKDDLSGLDRRQVYMWVLRGEGREVLADLALTLAPDKDARSNPIINAQRIKSLKGAGLSVAGHEELAFELRGTNARKTGGSGPSLDEVAVSVSKDKELDLTLKGYARLLEPFRLVS